MNRPLFLKAFFTFLGILSALNLSLGAQESEGCCEAPAAPDYIYYNAEESSSIGGNRVAILIGSAIVAGGVIGAVAISLTSRHHKGSGSARYSEISKDLSNDIDFSESDSADKDFYNFNSENDSEFFSDYGSEGANGFEDKNKFTVVEERRNQLNDKSETLKFSIGVDHSLTGFMLTAYVEGPDGTIIEGEPEILTSSKTMLDIMIVNPTRGHYHAGVKSSGPTEHLNTTVTVIDDKDQVTILDRSGMYAY